MNLLQPGRGVTLTENIQETFGDVPAISDVILDLFPQNVFQAFSEGEMSQVVVFAIFLGIASLLLPEEQRQMTRQLFVTLAELLKRLVGIVLHFGPIGIGALAASTVGQYGTEIFGPMALFLVGIWGAQLSMVLFYLTALYGFTGMSPASFLKQTAPLYATTAATCSSLASLVVSLDLAERRLRIPRGIYTFTLPLGAQLNKDGTAIMLAGVLLFTAQAADIEFSIASQVTIIVVGLLLSEGSGGIPGGGLVVALIFVQAFQLPLEIAAVVGGIYRLIDMGSTTINCMGDMVGTLIVSRFEPEEPVGATDAS